MSVRELKRMRKIADERANRFSSDGLRAFVAMLRRELDDEFFDSVREHLLELKLREGVLLSVELGEGNEATAAMPFAGCMTSVWP